VAYKKRKNRKRKNQKFRTLKILFILTLLVGLSLYVASLPIWKINEVVVNGAKLLSAKEIKTLAAIPLSENLFFVNLSRTRANLAKIPAIKDFSIYRIPPGTILISLTERQPIATVVFAKRSAIIDQEGYILNRKSSISLNIPNIADLPVISGISERAVDRGEKINEKTAQVVSDIILKLSYFLESRSMQLELGELKNVTFLLDDLLRVKVGEAENIKRKMEVFEALLPKIAGRWPQVAYVDVRYPDFPTIRYK